MAEARQRDQWSRTSCLLSLLYNLNRSPQTPASKPSDFDPFKARTSTNPQSGVGFRILKAVFVDSLPHRSGGLIGGGSRSPGGDKPA